MKTWILTREQIVHSPAEEVFDFFADARNLETLTPPWLKFEILTPGQIDMHAGTIIQYALRVHGLRVHWTTAISAWKPCVEFVDTQLKGPYVLWHHRHRFESLGDRTRMTDEVHYRLPFGLLGIIAHTLFVKRDLKEIFDYRARTIDRIFNAGVGHSSGDRV